MQKDLNYYISKFRDLNVNKRGGIAPYQPLLLLSVIDLIGQGYILDNKIYLTTTLMSVFVKYRSQLSTPNYQADLAQPFFYMSRADQTFWHLKPKPGCEEIVGSGLRLNKVSLLLKNVEYAYLDDELFAILQSSINRNTLIGIITAKWFADKIPQIQKLFSFTPFQIKYSQSLTNQSSPILASESIEDSVYNIDKPNIEDIVRDTTFRKMVTAFYDYRCVFCRLRIVSITNENIVDGSHIKPFSKFKDDNYTNGIALCKNHHWAFDHGWFGVDDDYRILIPNNRFDEQPPANSKEMKDFHGEHICLPDEKEFYPSVEALQWHRERWNIA